MQLFIKTLTGRTITVDCERDDTVFDVKLRIEDKEGIPVDQILLIFLGEKMEGLFVEETKEKEEKNRNQKKKEENKEKRKTQEKKERIKIRKENEKRK